MNVGARRRKLPVWIFISSVQREFAREREQLRDFLRGHLLMRRFFEVFLSEEAPASYRDPDRAYLDEVDRCDIYVGLFGRNYGIEDAGPARMNLRPLTTQPPGNEERVSLASNKSNTVPVGTVYRSRPYDN